MCSRPYCPPIELSKSTREALETDYPRIREVVAIVFDLWQVVVDEDVMLVQLQLSGVALL